MAARDILSLDNSIAPRLIRCLYIVALILIAVMVVLGVMRGIRILSRPPVPPAAMADSAAPGAVTPAPGMMQGSDDRRMMGERRMGRRAFGGGRMGMFGMGRNPMLAGAFAIFVALLRGAIVLMVVRVLAEAGLAVLAMPRKSEL